MVVKKALHTPVPKSALPAFTPVPRKQPRHDGWTPERQRAFIEALADTGCVSIACRMVNMSQPSFYHLRRQPGAESFRAAAEAAQTLGLQCVKDEAFDRAMNGELIPVFVAGKLMGFRRKKNDRILMFILRHYGQDAQGRKTTINYFSTRATAGAAAQNPPLPGGEGRGEGSGVPGSAAAAEASTTTVKTVISQPPVPGPLPQDTQAANLLNAFEGVALDAEAQAEIYRTLEACAERRRALEAEPEHDPERFFIGEEETNGYLGQLESGYEGDWVEYRPEGEHRWEGLGEGGNAAEIDRVVGEMQARLAAETPEARAEREAAEAAMARAEWEKSNKPLPGYLGGGTRALPKPESDVDDPKLDWRNWKGGTYTPPSESARPEPVEGPSSEIAPSPEPPVPSPRTPKRAYKKRTRKPRAAEGTPDPACPGPRSWDPGPTLAKAGAKRPYKKRTPKRRFALPEAGSAAYEARKARAIEEVEAERRVAAAAEAKRRERRPKR